MSTRDMIDVTVEYQSDILHYEVTFNFNGVVIHYVSETLFEYSNEIRDLLVEQLVDKTIKKIKDEIIDQLKERLHP